MNTQIYQKVSLLINSFGHWYVVGYLILMRNTNNSINAINVFIEWIIRF